MDTLGIEPRASRMLSGCDTTTPCALSGMFDAMRNTRWLLRKPEEKPARRRGAAHGKIGPRRSAARHRAPGVSHLVSRRPRRDVAVGGARPRPSFPLAKFENSRNSTR